MTSPEKMLDELRREQKKARGRVRDIRARMAKRAKRIKRLAGRVALAAKLARHKVRRPFLVIGEAEIAGLELHYALAMLEKETGPMPQDNVFGCDHGAGRAFCHEKVTAARVDALLASGLMNGVGWTQITWRDFVVEAEKLGGAHRPRNQMRVGFRLLAGLQRSNGPQDGFRAYNGSGSAAEQYGRDAMALAAKWKERIA